MDGRSAAMTLACFQEAYDLREQGLLYREIAERQGVEESTARRRVIAVETLLFAWPATHHNPEPAVTCVCGTDVNDTREHDEWHWQRRDQHDARYRWKPHGR